VLIVLERVIAVLYTRNRLSLSILFMLGQFFTSTHMRPNIWSTKTCSKHVNQ